jgi:hypothetical protein
LKDGYCITKLFEVYHFPKTDCYDPATNTGGLFTSYVRTFVTMKYESSGWPPTVVTDAEKEAYILKVKEEEHMVLNPDNMRLNPGMRTISKLSLNGLSGKFAQRDDRLATKYCTEPAEFFSFLYNDKNKVSNISFEGKEDQETAVFRYRDNLNLSEGNANVNVLISAFITGWGRLTLLEALRKVPRGSLFYADTDSSYNSRRIDCAPYFSTSTKLGDLTDELAKFGEGSHITAFVTAGAKNYAYKVYKASTNEIETFVRVRGFPISFRNGKILNFDLLSQMVTEGDQARTVSLVNPTQIVRKNHVLLTTQQTKNYRIVLTKRRLLPTFDTIPWGF